MELRRIKYLDFARSIAIISITVNHAVNRSFNIYSGQYEEFCSIPLFVTIIKTMLYCFSRIGVPLFLMISGALLLPRDYTKGGGYSKFIKHNWKQLLITTELWLIIMFWYKQLSPESILLKKGIGECLFRFCSTLLFVNQETNGSMWYMPMILCLYLMIPIISIALKNIDNRCFILPVVFVLVCSYLLPDINGTLEGIGIHRTLKTELDSANIFSMFAVYLLCGYFIRNGVLARVQKHIVLLAMIAAFIAFCAFQLWFYSIDYNFVVAEDYRSIFPMLTSIPLFELLRRMKPEGMSGLSKTAEKLSLISFGIYFVHICIMQGLDGILGNLAPKLPNLIVFCILEGVSFFGSILIISILKKNRWISKNLFVIKS